MFQAVFAWSEAPIGWIEGAAEWASGTVEANMAEGFLRDFLIEGRNSRGWFGRGFPAADPDTIPVHPGA